MLLVRRAADRARLRIRQRLPRHRQCGRDRDLHPLAAGRTSPWCGRACSIFLGVLLSSGAVAFGIVSLLPVELILQVGSSAGFAMVFALLIAAIIWNLGTWYFGLPASSSHTLIGSIIGVGVANALMRGRDGTSGVDWAQGHRDRLGAAAVAAVRLRAAPRSCCCCSRWCVARNAGAVSPRPKGNQPPPIWIRGILILTCTRCQLLPRLERRPEGHGPDHADPDRHRADRLRAQPRAAGEPDRAVRGKSRTPRPR